MVCAAKGYPLVLLMAEPFSVERRKLMRFLGAKVVITPAAERAVGMVKKMEELAAAHGWFMPRQFENEANPDYHSRTTAREIIDDFAGERLDYWVTGYGTGGTLKGVARVLKKERPETKIIVCEPEDAQLLASGIAQARKPDGTPAAPHPTFKSHPMQGWTPDFIPKLTDDAVAMKMIDRIVPISGPDAIRCAKELATREGIFVGITSGATFAGALKIAGEAEKGSTILALLPDTGERYLSTPLFGDIAADMNAEELAISRSTPSAQLPKPGVTPMAVSIVSRRIAAADAAGDKVKQFYFASRYGERRLVPGIADFTFGNPHEMPLPGLVAAIRERAVPHDKNWFAYKTSEAEPQAFLAETLGRELGLAFEPQDIALTTGAFAAIMVAFHLVLDAGDEAVFSEPAWFCYEPMLLAADAMPRKVPLRRPRFRSRPRRDRCGDRAARHGS